LLADTIDKVYHFKRTPGGPELRQHYGQACVREADLPRCHPKRDRMQMTPRGRQAMKRILGAALAVSLTTAPALPASIIKTPGPNGSHDVTISGTINLDDEKTFEALVMGDGHDTIYLDGLGGNFFAGLQIGTIVHDRRFET
jgi:hypothetical protein